ncbi:(d)CMP kinase [Fuchsiella alkaliacetigena]|uniref:(d)CMP kinase n=1 Tax=Fuchsiella alkaliacetigena TaxID=957042 RepID=UPI002009F5B9|nr:(d)CMP kinase [Fuchsiella alkaliacetigena]MCK8823937.1 (d)CMP kinase [Fuchsiella alkaliacetigena]
MKSDLVVAIDGPAGAGKSTIAKKVAAELGVVYIDTGAMYRAITLKALNRGVKLDSEAELAKLLQNTEILFTRSEGKNRILLDGEDVTEEIRSSKVNNNVSLVAKVPIVRERLVDWQQRLAKDRGVVMDGRDIGTVVLPEADLKIFLTASSEERARRRYQELKDKGESVDFAKLKADIIQRDKLDSEREISPLKKSPDAIEIDSTDLTIQEVVAEVLALCQEEL